MTTRTRRPPASRLERQIRSRYALSTPAPGGSIPTPAATAAADPNSATPATAGGAAPAEKPDSGDTTSTHSATSNTNGGNADEPKPEPRSTELPGHFQAALISLFRHFDAEEAIAIQNGAAVLHVAGYGRIELNFGDWILARRYRAALDDDPPIVSRVEQQIRATA